MCTVNLFTAVIALCLLYSYFKAGVLIVFLSQNHAGGCLKVFISRLDCFAVLLSRGLGACSL